ncbi:MAG: hypothetical protein AAGE99_00225 [Chlamydiota bacterium]
MRIPQGELQLTIAPFQAVITSNIAQASVTNAPFDSTIVAPIHADAVDFLSKSPSHLIQSLIKTVGMLVLLDKYRRSPKSLAQLAAKRLSLAVLSYCPPLLIKLAYNAIGYKIDMNGRKKRTLYIIFTVALGASMALYFLKTHRKAYDESDIKRVARHALAQIVVQIAAIEIFDWNDRTIAKKIDCLRWHQSLENYRDIGPKTKAAIDKRKNN